jgi:hypothetical protein
MVRSRFLVLLTAMAIAATGCASAAENIVENALENAIEEEVGSGNAEVDIDEDDGSVSIETDEGSIQIGGTDIPSDFPLPVPDIEEVLGVTSQSSGGAEYTQVILSIDPDDLDEIADLYEGFFEDQGWETSRIDSSSGDARNLWITGTGDGVDAAASLGYSDGDDAATLSLSYSASG